MHIKTLYYNVSAYINVIPKLNLNSSNPNDLSTLYELEGGPNGPTDQKLQRYEIIQLISLTL